MKIIGYIFMFLISSTSCTDIRNDDKKDVQFPLKGTQWTSKFYKYRNNYHFITDSTGFSQHGEVSWHYPSKDSIDYEVDDSFRYFIKDSILTLKYISSDHDSLNEHRIFYLERTDTNKMIFKSKNEFAYGHEFLKLKN